MGEKVAWWPRGESDKIDARLVSSRCEGDAPQLKFHAPPAALSGQQSIVIGLINPEMIKRQHLRPTKA